jgi:hypothetical protein
VDIVEETVLVAILFVRLLATLDADDVVVGAVAGSDDYRTVAGEILDHDFYIAPLYCCLDCIRQNLIRCYPTHCARRHCAHDIYHLLRQHLLPFFYDEQDSAAAAAPRHHRVSNSGCAIDPTYYSNVKILSGVVCEMILLRLGVMPTPTDEAAPWPWSDESKEQVDR